MNRIVEHLTQQLNWTQTLTVHIKQQFNSQIKQESQHEFQTVYINIDNNCLFKHISSNIYIEQFAATAALNCWIYI